jgi:hypothetical protein
MALMLRYLGIPARVAAGFTSGRYDRDNRTWVVSDHDAHTWVEAWFDGYGWLSFDPTPGRGRLPGAYTASSARFNPSEVSRLLELSGGDPATAFADEISQRRVGDLLRVQNAGSGSRAPELAERGGSLLGVLLLLAGACLGVIAATKVVVRRGRYLTRDPHRLVRACRAELGDFLRDQKVDVPESATFAELGEVIERVGGVRATRFVTAASAARYGRPDRAEASARRACREAAALRRALRRRLTARDRLRGLVSVRSLGLSA